MGQIFWKYIDKENVEYDVSIYHGDNSRHVLIYSGYKIIVIDFTIKEDKTYSFMLGDSLFSLSIVFINSLPTYQLYDEADQKELIPLDLNSRPEIRKDIILLIILMFTIFVFLLLYFLFIH